MYSLKIDPCPSWDQKLLGARLVLVLEGTTHDALYLRVDSYIPHQCL